MAEEELDDADVLAHAFEMCIIPEIERDPDLEPYDADSEESGDYFIHDGKRRRIKRVVIYVTDVADPPAND